MNNYHNRLSIFLPFLSIIINIAMAFFILHFRKSWNFFTKCMPRCRGNQLDRSSLVHRIAWIFYKEIYIRSGKTDIRFQRAMIFGPLDIWTLMEQVWFPWNNKLLHLHELMSLIVALQTPSISLIIACSVLSYSFFLLVSVKLHFLWCCTN